MMITLIMMIIMIMTTILPIQQSFHIIKYQQTTNQLLVHKDDLVILLELHILVFLSIIIDYH